MANKDHFFCVEGGLEQRFLCMRSSISWHWLWNCQCYQWPPSGMDQVLVWGLIETQTSTGYSLRGGWGPSHTDVDSYHPLRGNSYLITASYSEISIILFFFTGWLWLKDERDQQQKTGSWTQPKYRIQWLMVKNCFPQTFQTLTIILVYDGSTTLKPLWWKR